MYDIEARDIDTPKNTPHGERLAGHVLTVLQTLPQHEFEDVLKRALDLRSSEVLLTASDARHSQERVEAARAAVDAARNGYAVATGAACDATQAKIMPHGIGWAVMQLFNGARVARAGWNGKGQYLELQRVDKLSKMTRPYVFITTVEGDRVPWLASQSDLLAADWNAWRAVE